jgi:hypothetical protein
MRKDRVRLMYDLPQTATDCETVIEICRVVARRLRGDYHLSSVRLRRPLSPMHALLGIPSEAETVRVLNDVSTSEVMKARKFICQGYGLAECADDETMLAEIRRYGSDALDYLEDVRGDEFPRHPAMDSPLMSGFRDLLRRAKEIADRPEPGAFVVFIDPIDEILPRRSSSRRAPRIGRNRISKKEISQ